MPEYDEFTDHGVRWAVRPDVRDELFGPAGFRLQEWIDAGLTEVVKTGPARTVYRVDLPRRTLFVKHFLVPSAGEFVRRLILPSKGRCEWRRAHEVADRRIPTIEPLALGERYRFGTLRENYLVTLGIDAGEPLDKFLTEHLAELPGRRASRVRRRVAVGLAELIASAHREGVLHTDLHAGNILVRLGADDQVELFLIDLHAVRTGGPLTRRRALGNLAQLNLWFSQVSSRADRSRFFRRYAQLQGLTDRRERARLARLLEARTERICRRFWAKRDRRAVTNNKYFYFLVSRRAQGHAVSELDREQFAALMADPDASFRDPDALRLKDGDNSIVVRRTLALRGRELPVVFKRFNPRPVHTTVSAMAHGSKAMRAWRAGHALLVRGLPTPRPIAAFDVRALTGVGATYLITEEVPGAKDLARFVDEDVRPLAEPEQARLKRQLIDRLASLIGRLHWHRLDQRDLKAANILASRPADGELALWLLDLEGLHVGRRLPRARWVQNVARLNVSFHEDLLVTRTDRLRFLKRYMRQSACPEGDWRRVWRDVEQATERKIARNIRHGRIVT